MFSSGFFSSFVPVPGSFLAAAVGGRYKLKPESRERAFYYPRDERGISELESCVGGGEFSLRFGFELWIMMADGCRHELREGNVSGPHHVRA